MSLALTIFLLVVGWLTVAAAMLWGVMRVSRRQPPPAPVKPAPTQSKATKAANAH